MERKEWVLGGQVDYQETLFVSLATHMNFNGIDPYQYSVGAEYVSPHHFAVKAGYRVQPGNNFASWSTGLSVTMPEIALHYAVEFPSAGSSESAEHILAATLLF